MTKDNDIYLMVNDFNNIMRKYPSKRSDIENNMLKCYETAKNIYMYKQGTPTQQFKLHIYQAAICNDTDFNDSINNFVNTFTREAEKNSNQSELQHDFELQNRNKPLLDRI